MHEIGSQGTVVLYDFEGDFCHHVNVSNFPTTWIEPEEFHSDDAT